MCPDTLDGFNISAEGVIANTGKSTFIFMIGSCYDVTDLSKEDNSTCKAEEEI